MRKLQAERTITGLQSVPRKVAKRKKNSISHEVALKIGGETVACLYSALEICNVKAISYSLYRATGRATVLLQSASESHTRGSRYCD